MCHSSHNMINYDQSMRLKSRGLYEILEKYIGDRRITKEEKVCFAKGTTLNFSINE